MTKMREAPEIRLMHATLAAAKRSYSERHMHVLKPRTLQEASSNGVLTQREVTPLTQLLREEVTPRQFAACAYVPPKPPSDDGPKMAGAALFELLSLDEVEFTLCFCEASAMGALVVAHRAFAHPVEEAARDLLKAYATAPAPIRCRVSNAFCEPAWRALLAARRYHTATCWASLGAGGAHSLLLLPRRRDGDGGDGDDDDEEDDDDASSSSSSTKKGDGGGVVSACGRGTCGQLGLGPAAYDVGVPRAIAAPMASIVSVSAGAHHSLAVGADGSLWAWGKASDHQLGLGSGPAGGDLVTVPTPTRVVLREVMSATSNGTGRPVRCASVSAGAAHSLAVDVDGGVWSWGRNAHGQLGVGGTRPSPTPKRILPLRARSCVSACAGSFHSFVVVDDGTLYAFGLGADGRLGLGHTLNASLPEKVPLDAFCRAAAAGAAHGACVADDGALYTWGDGSKGALGHTGPRPKKTEGKKSGGLGSMPSWESARALGEVLQFSSTPAPECEHAPRRVAALAHVRVVAVSANERETVCLDTDGVVYVLAQPTHGSSSSTNTNAHGADANSSSSSSSFHGPEGRTGAVGRPRAASFGAASPTAGIGRPQRAPSQTSPTAGIGRARSSSTATPRNGGGGAGAPKKPKSAVVTHTFHAPVAELATSALHTVVKTVDGTYFAWGDGDGGLCLGVGDNKGRAKPTMLPWP